MVNQCSHNDKQKSLAYIAEHHSEDEGIGDSHKKGWVNLIVGRQPVHTDEHLERLENLRVFQFCRRFSEVAVMVVLHDNKNLVVLLRFRHKLFDVLFCHPTAEDIVIFFFIFHPGRHLTDVEIVSKLFQPLLRPHKLRGFLFQHLRRFFIQVINFLLDFIHFLQKLLACFLRRSFVLRRNLNPLKMK